MKLTDAACKNALPNPPPSKTPRKLPDGNGLYLWVMPNGSKYWRFRYKDFLGKNRELAIGVYPEIPLKKARSKTLEARGQLREWSTPIFKSSFWFVMFAVVLV